MNKSIPFLITFVIIFLSVTHLHSIGTIIVLHGTGSSGKTSISKILRQKLPDAVAVGVDDFLWPALIENGINRKLIKKSMTKAQQQQLVIDNRAILSGDLEFRKIIQKLYEHVQTLAQDHQFVILDTVFTSHSDYNRFCEITNNCSVYSVLVYCHPINLAEHVMKRNRSGAIAENRDIFSHLRNFVKLYKKSNDPDTTIDTISQQEINKTIEIIISYAQHVHIKRSRRKEKITQLQERFEQKFFNKNSSKVNIAYLFPYDIMVDTGEFSTAACVELILSHLTNKP